MRHIKFENTKRVRKAVAGKLGGTAPVQLPDDTPSPMLEVEAPKAPAAINDLPNPLVYVNSKTSWATFKAQPATRPLGGLGATSALWEEFLQKRRKFGLQGPVEELQDYQMRRGANMRRRQDARPGWGYMVPSDSRYKHKGIF
jgi:hypothetical protein